MKKDDLWNEDFDIAERVLNGINYDLDLLINGENPLSFYSEHQISDLIVRLVDAYRHMALGRNKRDKEIEKEKQRG